MAGTIDRTRYASDNCSVGRTLAVVGERWTFLVLREAFYGQRRFEDIQSTLGVARNVLAARLQTLVEHGLLVRRPYREPGKRERFEYRLTDRGTDLFPALVALMEWGDKHLPDEAGPPVALEHRDCGARLHVELVCEAGHRGDGALGGLTARDATPVPGPGARLRDDATA
ncbi:winged helix-turn-helix transcriptional regulator [Yinghuangia seranimata]|uniref:winged helix-turn-helix transcriptional regulator n=1 Tax=Yinghuangia seranimata TaxID=408067 RepID=UPI00248AE0DA|nr:helix-turn-helix domain-containing protein [Yinghuangia seranimata]MDI2125642.1 helix-turn-helix domain-containing protein [Yinghuangia seranimata]